MINRAGNKEKAKRVLNENGNLSGMVGMEILYRVIAAITSVLLGAMIAGGIGVVSAVVSAPFKLFGLAGIIIAYVLITPIATLVGAIAGGAVAGPFEVARYRYYLSLRKNGIRPKVTCIFDAFDFFMQFALVTGVRMLTIMWIPVLIQFATLLLAAVVAAASRSYLAAMLLVMIGMIAALVVAAYRSYQFWPMALVQADHPQLNAEQVMERCKVMTEGHKFDLFVFDLSYLGWNILSLLTGGILSVLYVAPYKMMATAFVYEEMKGRPVMVDDIKPSTDGNGMTIAVDPKKLMGIGSTGGKKPTSHIISQVCYAFGRMFRSTYYDKWESESKTLEQSHGAVVSKKNGVYTYSDGYTHTMSGGSNWGFTSLGDFFYGIGDLFAAFYL